MQRISATVRGAWLSSLLFLALACAMPAHATDPVSFTRVDAQLGVHVTTVTYGPTVGDYNGDGFDDVFSGNHGATPNLFRNVLGTAFDDDWQGSGIALGGDRHGAAWGDFDNDGHRDLYVTIGAQMGQGVGYNQLYRNLDGTHFEDIALEAGVVDSLGRGRFPYWLDADNDGWLDLFVCNMETPNKLFLNQGDGTFSAVPQAGGLEENVLWYAAWTQLNDDRLMDVILGAGYRGRIALFMNAGQGSFVEVTTPNGLPTSLANVYGFCWLDYDNDGDQDLYLSRGYSTENGDAFWSDSSSIASALMYMPPHEEQEDGLDGLDFSGTYTGLYFTFTVDWDATPYELIYLGAAGIHPITKTFYVGNGQYLGRPAFTPGASLGCYIWQDSLSGPWHMQCSTDYNQMHRFGCTVTPYAGTFTAFSTVNIEIPLVTDDLSDRLYRNLGNGTFQNVSGIAHIHDDLTGQTPLAADFNNDGWLDLYVVNARNVSGYIAHHDPCLLYLNNGNGTFTECAVAAGADCQVEGTGAGAGWCDYDNDGFPDLFLTNGWSVYPFNRGPHVVYHNEGNGNHWVKLRLVGISSNRDGIGARVRIVAGGHAQYRVQNGAVSDMSQSSMDLHFGLGAATMVDSLTIWWPYGTIETYTQLSADWTYELTEFASHAVADPRPELAGLILDSPAPNPFCRRAALTYHLATPGPVRLEIIDPAGRRVRTLVDTAQTAGSHTAVWDARDAAGWRVAPGVYYSRLSCGDVVCRRPLLLLR